MGMAKKLKFGFRFLLAGDYVSFHCVTTRISKKHRERLDRMMEYYGHVGLAFEDAIERQYFDGICEILNQWFPGCVLQLDDN